MLLAETVGAAVDRMDDEVVTAELLRSHCPIEGTLTDKRRRLQNRICMSLGEMSMSAANMNTSLHFLKNASPEIGNNVSGLIQGDLEALNETFTTSQKCIEDTLKLVVDNIVEIKSEVAGMKNSSTPTTVLPIDTNAGNNCGEGTKKMIMALTKEVRQCTSKVSELLKRLSEVENNLKVTSGEIQLLKENAVEIMRSSVRDMEGYHNSVFSDESRVQLKEIYDIVVAAYKEPVPENGEGSVFGLREASNVLNTDEQTPNQQGEHQSAATEDTRVVGGPSPSFNFPDRLSPSLGSAVKSKHKIDVWLITDSIMRHITDDDMNFKEKYRVQFQRIDKTCTDSLADQELLQSVATKKPHVIYLHLGINDIQKGSNPAEILKNIERFDKKLREVSPNTKLILSSPLLNGNNNHKKNICSLGRSLIFYMNKHEEFSDYVQARLFVQQNLQFTFNRHLETRSQNRRYFKRDDKLHLSDRGKTAITCIMRDTLNVLLNAHEEQP